MIDSQPYSVRSARHHFRNYLGIIRGFSEILMEGLRSEEARLAHFIFMIETVDRIQKFIDRVLPSEEVLKRAEWKKPFWINVEHDVKSILKTVEALLILEQQSPLQGFKEDLLKIQSSGLEILKFSEEFINHSFDNPTIAKE